MNRKEENSGIQDVQLISALSGLYRDSPYWITVVQENNKKLEKKLKSVKEVKSG